MWAGYNLPAFIDVFNNSVSDGGGNLLAGAWTFTVAPVGSDAYIFDDGTSVPSQAFGSVVLGSYDTFSQSFAAVVKITYDCTFTYENGQDPSALIVSTGAVPEPAAWALMLLGMGMAGAAIHGRKALAA